MEKTQILVEARKILDTHKGKAADVTQGVLLVDISPNSVNVLIIWVLLMLIYGNIKLGKLGTKSKDDQIKRLREENREFQEIEMNGMLSTLFEKNDDEVGDHQSDR